MLLIHPILTIGFYQFLCLTISTLFILNKIFYWIFFFFFAKNIKISYSEKYLESLRILLFWQNSRAYLHCSSVVKQLPPIKTQLSLASGSGSALTSSVEVGQRFQTLRAQSVILSEYLGGQQAKSCTLLVVYIIIIITI